MRLTPPGPTQAKKKHTPYDTIPESGMNILFVGAGVIGSVYAAKLVLAGQPVTVLARGKRLADIRKHGIILQHALSGEQLIARVDAVETLTPDDAYDLIVVPVRRDQVSEVLPMLAANRKSPNIMFMVNNPGGYDDWVQAVGRDRLLIGFPGAGGTIRGPVVEYVVVSRLLQPTTIGELDGRSTSRLRCTAEVFEKAGFPVAQCSDMNAWQKSHVAWVTPCSFGIYRALKQGKTLARSPDSIRLMVRAIREGFHILESLGVRITPGKLKVLEWLPELFLVIALKWWAGTRHFDAVAVRHSTAARSEMELLAREFLELARESSLTTPALDRLYSDVIRKGETESSRAHKLNENKEAGVR